MKIDFKLVFILTWFHFHLFFFGKASWMIFLLKGFALLLLSNSVMKNKEKHIAFKIKKLERNYCEIRR
jgi:hypothetical protein